MARHVISGMIPAPIETVKSVLVTVQLHEQPEIALDDVGQASFVAHPVDTGDKETLFSNLVGIVNVYGGFVEYHLCTHRDADPKPCIITERYARGE